MNLVLRGLAGAATQLVLIYVLMIAPAGLVAHEWLWPRGIQFLTTYAVLLGVSTVIMALIAPQSLEARLRSPASAEQPVADKLATTGVLAALALSVAFVPLDVFWWQVLGAPSARIASLAGWVAVAGYALCLWAIFVNAFAIPIVEDQSGAGQTLVTSGPYKLVRHPMYLSFLLMQAGAGVWLGSLASLGMLFVTFAALVPRVIVEEHMLIETLHGYSDYRAAIRRRILPFVW